MNYSTIKQICKIIDVNASELRIEEFGNHRATIETCGQTWEVAHEDTAVELAKERIEETLWAFNAEFIARHTATDLPKELIEALRKMQSELCEDANEIIKSMIEDLDAFLDEAIETDGLGHFLSSYDGEYHEVNGGALVLWRED